MTWLSVIFDKDCGRKVIMDNCRPALDYMLKEWLSEGAATDSTWLHVSCARRISDKQRSSGGSR